MFVFHYLTYTDLVRIVVALTKETIMGRAALTTNIWIKQATRTHKGAYDYSKSVYTKYGELITITCPTHGDFVQRENNHRNGAGCPKCGVKSRVDKRSHTYDSFVQAARGVHGDSYDYPEQYIRDSRTKAQIVCPVHGEFEQLVYIHLAGKGCPRCGYERNGKRSQLSISEFLRRAQSVHGDTYEYVSGLSGLHKNMRIKCPVHGEFKQTPHNHLSGAGCPKCVGRISKGEQELADFVASLGLEIHCSDTSVLSGREIDVFIPSKKVGIEYNGLWYHRESLIGNKTREKWEKCTSKGVKLVQVFEDEWRHQRPLVEARLKAILGVSNTVYARKCIVTQPQTTEVREFLETHHLQGAGSTLSRAYGLRIDGELVAVATFGKGRFNNAGWELLRYASVGRVLGGISRLVKAFRKDHPEGTLVSYADLRWGDGEAYRTAGFRLESITEPDYWWADTSKIVRHSRYSVQPYKTGMSEKDYAAAQGWVKVLGVGHKKWVLDE